MASLPDCQGRELPRRGEPGTDGRGRATLEAVDQGELRITSTRSVFTGSRKSIEMPHAKLLDLDVYTDAIQFHVSGRQVPPMFQVTSGPMIAAAVNAASQKLL